MSHYPTPQDRERSSAADASKSDRDEVLDDAILLPDDDSASTSSYPTEAGDADGEEQPLDASLEDDVQTWQGHSPVQPQSEIETQEMTFGPHDFANVQLRQVDSSRLVNVDGSSSANASQQLVPSEWVADVEPSMIEKRSWVFRFSDWITSSAEWMLGVATLIVLLAIVSAIPVVQILTLGYLLECARRVTRTGKYWSGVVGAKKAARIGSLAVGTWLCLLPVQYLSSVWYASNLIDPTSTTTTVLRVLQIVFAIALIAHVLAAWYCGGKLRHFFWPIVAPFSLALWTVRKIADSPTLRPTLKSLVGWVSPHLVDDICRAKPLTDWFLPAVLLKGLFTGRMFARARDGLWDFVVGLKVPYLFWLGLRGFAGTVAWVFLPTIMLVGITSLPEAPAFLAGLAGAFLLSIVMIYVPFAQASFAHEGRMYALFDLGAMRRAFRGAPVLHVFSLFLLLALSLPLYLLKIERIPSELLWIPGVFFMIASWPTRMFVAWAFAKGLKREKPRIWLVRMPVRFLLLPVSLAFVFFVLFTPYLTWNGSLGLFEHHSILVPAPFFEWPFK